MTIPARTQTPALLQVDAILSRLSGQQALREVCRFLRQSFPHYPWVGIYRLEDRVLVLDAWEGPKATEHTRIPLDRGICGQAAREGRTVIVDDVNADPNYLACFLETRAEIVVPIRHEGRVVGEIDIDGNTVKAFDASDRRFLESVAAKLGPALERSGAELPRA
jgi:L-methionine (R)-S-oxide reductase